MSSGKWLQECNPTKTTENSENNPSDNHQTITGSIFTGSIFTGLIGAGFDYHINKMVSVGIETSLLPGKYKKLKDKASDYYTYEDNVSRLSTGLKLTLTL